MLDATRPENTASCPNQWHILLKTFLRHPLRIAGRSAWLAGELLLVALGYFVRVTSRRHNSGQAFRADWLQWGCQRLLRVFDAEVRTAGVIPTRGLLVSNHLGYLDILAFGAMTPALFVAKHEVRNWPIFGWFARRAGTLFLRRQKRGDVARVTAEIERALGDGMLVALFPEGTSSGGETVLPFKSALLASITQQEQPLTAAFIDYSLADGSVPDEVCYWRDMTLAPHLLNLLGKDGLSACISFAPVSERPRDRKAIALQLHDKVIRLKGSRRLSQPMTSA